MSTLSIDLALPLPPLTADIFIDHQGTNGTTTPKADKVKHTFVPKDDRPEEDERSDLFVVRQLGGNKRKRTDATEEQNSAPALDPMHDDEITIDQEDTEELQRAREKAAKKALKKQKKREEAAQASLEYDEPAFDYTTAPTVLHANDDSGKKGKKDKKEKKKGFTSFANMRDAPRGLPQKQKERAGKAKTFTR